jgi:hypothetical protein
MKRAAAFVALAALIAAVGATAAGPSARGSGHITFGSSREHISFTASGSTGEAVVVDHTVSGTVVFHLAIDCVRIVGNEATLSGTVTESTNEELVPTGFEGVFQVVDNGQGGQAPPDLMSLVNLHEVGTSVDCLVPAEYDLAPVEGGNIEVG